MLRRTYCRNKWRLGLRVALLLGYLASQSQGARAAQSCGLHTEGPIAECVELQPGLATPVLGCYELCPDNVQDYGAEIFGIRWGGPPNEDLVPVREDGWGSYSAWFTLTGEHFFAGCRVQHIQLMFAQAGLRSVGIDSEVCSPRALSEALEERFQVAGGKDPTRDKWVWRVGEAGWVGVNPLYDFETTPLEIAGAYVSVRGVGDHEFFLNEIVCADPAPTP